MSAILTDPVQQEEFFGRAALIKQLLKRVRGLAEGYRQNVALLGRRSVGKSSILQRVLTEAKQRDFLTVYVEVRQEPFLRFAERWIATVSSTVFEHQGIQIGDFWRVSPAEFAERYPELARHMDGIRSLANRQAFGEAFEHMMRLPALLHEQLRLPIVVILESFERLDQWSIPNPFALLGREIMIQPNTMFLITSASPVTAQRILAERFSLLFGNFEVIEVPPFDLSESCAYLQRGIGAATVPLHMMAFLAELAGGVPFYLHMIGKSLESRQTSERQEPSFDGLIERLEQLLFHADGPLYHYCSSRRQEFCQMLAHQTTGIVLAALEQRRHRFSDLCRLVPRSSQGISTLLNRMSQAGMVERSGCFSYLTDPLWGLWECHVYQPREMGPDGNLARLREHFRRVVTRRYESFLQANQTLHSERIAGLFRLFRRDRVRVDDYERWLVPFAHVTRCRDDQLGGEIVSGQGNDGRWIAFLKSEGLMTDREVGEFLSYTKRGHARWHRKILIPLADIDEHAALLAKSQQMWVWTGGTMNYLMRLYGQPPIVSAG